MPLLWLQREVILAAGPPILATDLPRRQRLTRGRASCLTSCDFVAIAGWQRILVLVTKSRNFYVRLFILRTKLVVSAIPTGFRAGLSGSAQQGRTGPGRRPLMLSSFCDRKPGKCTFLVPHNSSFHRKTLGFEHNLYASSIRTSALSLGFCGENWGYAELDCTNQVDISRDPRLSFFLSQSTR